MPANKRAISTDLDKLDAHEIRPEEYDDIPELSDEWFEKAELRRPGTAPRRRSAAAR